MPAGATRLDAELVRQGLARSRRRAADLVAEGRVRVAGQVARKPSQSVPATSVIAVTGARDQYVSRGAYKLAGALDALDAAGSPVLVSGRRCLDAGASTGGFTQVLLERGATQVVAVDVGHDQLSPVLAADPRVESREGTNVRDLVAQDVGGAVDLVVADLSFISLSLVLPRLAALVRSSGDILVLVKPQFEVGRERLGSSGVVTDVEGRVDAVRQVVEAAGPVGRVAAVAPSPLPGPKGNREYFLLLRPGIGPATSRDATAAVDAAVREGRTTVIRDGGL